MNELLFFNIILECLHFHINLNSPCFSYKAAGMFIWLLMFRTLCWLDLEKNLCLYHMMFLNAYMLIKFCCAFDDLLWLIHIFYYSFSQTIDVLKNDSMQYLYFSKQCLLLNTLTHSKSLSGNSLRFSWTQSSHLRMMSFLSYLMILICFESFLVLSHWLGYWLLERF